MAAACAAGAFVTAKRRAAEKAAAAAPPKPAAVSSEQRELSWDDVESVDAVGLEVGYRLIPLVDRAQGGELMGRIKGVRKKLTEELGFLVQPVHIRDNLELGPNSYRITILGAPVGESEVFPDRELAINPGQVSGTLPGSATKDPAFGLDAVWIDKSRRDQAQAQGYTVVDAGSVIATHLSHLLQSHAHELLGHEEVQQLLNRLGKSAPEAGRGSGAEDPADERGRQGVAAAAARARADPQRAHRLRDARGARPENSGSCRRWSRQCASPWGAASCRTSAACARSCPSSLSMPSLEQVLQDTMASGGDAPGFEPGLADKLQQSLIDRTRRQEAAGEPAVLLVAPKIRPWVARLMRYASPTLSVLAYNEIPESRRIRVICGGRTLMNRIHGGRCEN